MEGEEIQHPTSSFPNKENIASLKMASMSVDFKFSSGDDIESRKNVKRKQIILPEKYCEKL